ncbi:unnamed protein product [Diatraea saccharalis]|uniref:Glutathione peroxidase n=1 Tax=Diatraea saccharalis TaxID=40085 RepID=A0A9N9WGS5_9NEOP|nr:unnamed protein product [Diatraea saccharalis]
MAKKPANKSQIEYKGPNTISKSTSSGSVGKLLFVFAILGGLLAFYVYKVVTTPPDLPKYDVNNWWGPYPIDQQKDVSIRPFKIEFSDVIVNDLRERLMHRRPFVPPLEGTGFDYGFNSNFLGQVLHYWENKYNFKDRQNFFNKFDHYKTNIQGLDIHYIHVKPKVSADIEVLPLLMLHGWPGSIREFYELIPKLTTPRPGDNFVFEIIAPSLPGFGYSQSPARKGFGPVETAVLMSNLMKRVGRTQYYIQGGDFGHVIGSTMATLFPEQILGFHTNMPVNTSPVAMFYLWLGSLWPSMLVEHEVQDRVYPLREHVARLLQETGYLHLQATKPDTLGISLTDSPAGLAAYILEKFSTWTNPEFINASDGRLLDKFQLTHLLDNVMMYWAPNSIATSIRTYAEIFSTRTLTMRLDDIPTDVPTWGIKFKHELLFFPDCLLRLKYKNYLHSTMVEEGGHFAAFEMPDVMAKDIFEAVKTFREFHGNERTPSPKDKRIKTIYDFTVKDLSGKEIKLEKYKGYVVLIVNVASQCGLTDTNYKQLNELYEKYSDKGLRILAFPCNQFGGQEPGSAEEIFKFISNRGVKFDIFEKISVNGENAHPLWQFLKNSQSGMIGDFIKWNFSKFLVDRNGVPVDRFAPTVSPLDLESYLVKYL